jgi:predicted transcriptional regulator
MVDEEPVSAPFLSLTCKIVAAYVRKNPVPVSGVPNVIESVHNALKDIVTEVSASTGNAQKPAVPVKKSVTAAYIVCLEDGRKLKMLKRYLRTRYALSPQEYRTKWRLPADYPMVAPNYAEQRSAIAKKTGLGRMRPAVNRRRKRG